MQARYQYGNLMLRKRKKGPDVWQFRWLENGRQRSVLIGTLEKLPTRADAERAVESLRVRINTLNPQSQFHSVTVGALTDLYMEERAKKKCRKNTWKNYECLFKKYVRPKWQSHLVEGVDATEMESWFDTLSCSGQVKSHIKNLLHGLFKFAMKRKMVTYNPIDLVDLEFGSSVRDREPRALTPNEVKDLLGQLSEPYKTMVITALSLGLRVSELVALKWGDVDFDNLTVNVQRAFVRGAINPTKTKTSKGILPLDPVLAEILLKHKGVSKHKADEGFVFAGESGKVRWPESMLQDYLKPAAVKAGIGKIGWHTFRHTYSTLLHSLGTTAVVQKELLRHSDIRTTLNVYTRAVSEEKRVAASKLAQLYDFVLGAETQPGATT